MDTVHARWSGRRQFVAWDTAGHGLVMDAPTEHGGEGTGVRPIEVVLYGLAGCTGMDVVSILEKQRQDVRGLEVVVQGTQREDDFPHHYESIDLEYVVTGHDVSPAAVERAIGLSESKYCSVRGMFGPHVKVKTSFRVLEASAPGTPVREHPKG